MKSTQCVVRHMEGIENHNNSCYLDSTLFSMFYREDIFDEWVLDGKYVKENRNHVADVVTENLQNIVGRLRNDKYCPSKYVTELRMNMREINSRLVSAMMGKVHVYL